MFGVGFGFVNPPITYTAVSGMPNNQAGVAAAVASTSRQIGQALGVAVMGSILGAAVGGEIGVHLASASHPAWWVVAGCGVSVFAMGAASTGQLGTAHGAPLRGTVGGGTRGDRAVAAAGMRVGEERRSS